MKFNYQDSGAGPILIISDITPGAWSIADIAAQLTIGGAAYADAIANYNGIPGEPYTDVVAIPKSWLNAAGLAYFNYAQPSNVQSVSINGAGAMQQVTATLQNMTPAMKIALVAAVGLVIYSLATD